jgi:hypothetical protein
MPNDTQLSITHKYKRYPEMHMHGLALSMRCANVDNVYIP